LEAQGNVGPGLTFHGLRHTAGNRSTRPAATRARSPPCSGQPSEAMARHYSDEGDRRRRVVVAISRLEKAPPP
jgi:hypothetical protein